MHTITSGERARIQRYLALDEDALYALIPTYLPETEHTAYSPDGQIDDGRRFFDSIYVHLQKAICEDFDWPTKRNDPDFSDTVNLIATLADFISVYVTGVPPFIISSLCVKKGLNVICAYRIGSPQT